LTDEERKGWGTYVERVSLKHFGEKISSKEVSRVVAHVSAELDGFRRAVARRSLI
jgi:hypothetical protein